MLFLDSPLVSPWHFLEAKIHLLWQLPEEQVSYNCNKSKDENAMNKTIAHQLITTIGSTMIFNSYLITNYDPIHFQDLQSISINLLDKSSIKNVAILAV